MKGLFLICVLIMLPLQIPWAAIGSYCEHESGQAAQHLAHHDHQHEKSEGEQPTNGKLGISDSDCDYCHHFGANIVSDHAPALARPLDSTAVEFQLQRYISPGPTRPNWPLLG